MRLKAVEFDERELPGRVIVSMSVNEAAAIVEMFGGMSDLALREKMPWFVKYPEGESTIHDCLTRGVFNAYWENGTKGFILGDDQ